MADEPIELGPIEMPPEGPDREIDPDEIRREPPDRVQVPLIDRVTSVQGDEV